MSNRCLNFFLKKCLFIFFLAIPGPSLFAQHEQHTAQFLIVHKAKKTLPSTMKRVSIPRGAHRTVNLVVGYKTVNFAGKPRRAIAVNGQIPGPTLHFKEGDHVTINVYNHLNKDTSIAARHGERSEGG